MLSLLIALTISLVHSTPRSLSQILQRDATQSSLRISFHPLLGSFTEPHEQLLLQSLIPSVQSFYSSSLKLNRVQSPLKPSSPLCGPIEVPQVHQKSGLEADIIIYLHTGNISIPALGKVCEQEAGIYKRPLVGYITLEVTKFFGVYQGMQIQFLIRETAHVLAFDSKLFSDFVDSRGVKYAASRYMSLINYPERGVTVRTVAFPEMLLRAEANFDCELQGVEFLEVDLEGRGVFFWNGRIMTHDVLSEYVSDEAVFSEISMAVFEDSGWYKADYGYSQKLMWGFKAGCKWFEEKCVFHEKSSLPGFCDQSTSPDQCDVFALGHGDCYLTSETSLPPHHQYFSNKTLSGSKSFDFCPTITVPPTHKCRDQTILPSFSSGEMKSSNARCLTNTLSLSSALSTPKGGCYNIKSCSESSITVLVGSTLVACPYGSNIRVPGFEGYLHCPVDFSFCQNVPCKNLCSGKGKCEMGSCLCGSGWDGDDCSVACMEFCKKCSNGRCEECESGFFWNGESCFMCSSECRECVGSATQCTDCRDGQKLGDGMCLGDCLEHCKSCDNPCSICASGFFVSDGKCLSCSGICKTCDKESDFCTNCHEGFIVFAGKCIPTCLPGCTNCQNPCLSCKIGYMLSSDICLPCNNLCASCSSDPDICTSCPPGYSLIENTCQQSCKPHCLTCDDPCSKCEDGFFPNLSNCSPCDDSCQTCSQESSICTSCKSGYRLKGASCESDCPANCETCETPCKLCKSGFFLDMGECSKCDYSCKTCSVASNMCDSCNEGSGLIQHSCEPGCDDHCYTCKYRCTMCENGFYELNGVCIPCEKSCRVCTGLGDDKCHECATGYKKVQQKCEPICQEFCLSCDEPCSKCESGYFNFEKGCSKCDDNCETCEGTHSNCVTCPKGSALVGNSCSNGCVEHCYSCDYPCMICEPGFYSALGNCNRCESNCETCLSVATHCLSCKTGYILSGVTCKEYCVDHCLTCDNPCTVCEEGFVPKNSICVPCPLGCSSCSSTGSCFSCTSGYIFKDQSCIRDCLPNCKSCDSPCTVCESGFLLISDQCIPCNYPCTSCAHSLDLCTSCPDRYSLQKGTCKSDCLQHCLSCDNPCTECESGFLAFRGLCEVCSLSCQTCSGSPESCTSCLPGKVLVGDMCEKKCTEHCVDCSIPCRACNEGFSLVEDKCIACKHYLNKDEVVAEFIEDFKGVSVVFEYPLVRVENECGFYFKAVTVAMLGSGAECSWEGLDHLVIVFGKNPEYRIRTLEMFPVLAFGSYCDSKIEELQIDISDSALPNPIISLLAPNYFTLGCDNEVLVIEGITEEPIYSLKVTLDPEIKPIEDFIATLQGKYLPIPESILKPTHLTITFSATNFLGRVSSLSKTVIITKEPKLSVSIDAGSHVHLSTGQTFSIRGVLPQTSCTDHEKLTFQWKHLTSTSIYQQNMIQTLISQSKLPHVLLIKPGDLSIGSHLFRFEAFDHIHSDFSDIQVEVTASPLVVVLSRSDCSVSVNEDFKLSAKESYDPGSLDTVLSFKWECMQETQPCLDNRGVELLDEVYSDEVSIGANRMVSGAKYVFIVKVTNGNRIASASVLVTAANTSGAILIPTQQNSVNVQREFSVFPSFEVNENAFEWKWAQVSGPALKAKYGLDKPFIVFEEYQMVVGHSYVFRLRGTQNNSTIFSDLHFAANSGPKCENVLSTVIESSLTLSISCYDGDFKDFPLYYVYGFKYRGSDFPIKVVHSPSATFKLNPGSWSVYVQVCDSLQTCVQQDLSVTIAERKTQEIEDLQQYNQEKIFPDNIPLAIINSVNSFNKENFDEAFGDLKVYIKSQDLDLVHLKMAIECLEILTQSDKSHFMKHKQLEIVEFLQDIVTQLSFIDDEVMEYIIELFSQHGVQHYRQVAQLIGEFSERWVMQMPPGESKKIVSEISIVRHRFIGKDYEPQYIMNQVIVSNLDLQGDANRIYDLLITVFPNSPSSIVDVAYYEVGSYDRYNVEFWDRKEKVQIDLLQPFYLEFALRHLGEFSCVQLKETAWVDEGCTIMNRTRNSLLVSSWHVNTFRIVSTTSTQPGLASLIAEGVLLFLTFAGVAAFCILDKTKLIYVPDFADPESPRSRENSPQRIIQEKQSLPKLLFHPWLNIFIPQAADRRPASILYLSAVLIAEFISIGGMFNPKFKEIFDADNRFTGFSKAQITTGCVGLIFSQFLSLGVVLLNQPNDFTITKRYLGMAVCTIIIVFGSGLGIVFGLHYPAVYSAYWVLVFTISAAVELGFIQNLLWFVKWRVFKKSVDSELALAAQKDLRMLRSDN